MTAIVVAAESNSAASTASTRAPVNEAPLRSVFGSVVVTSILSLESAQCRRRRRCRAALTVWIGLAGRLGAHPNPCHIGIRGPGLRQQLVHPPDAVRRRVPSERQGRRESHTGTGPDLGAQRPPGPVERGSGRVGIRLVV